VGYLIGPYVDAFMFVKGEKGKTDAAKIINEYLKALDDRCIGSISEIFDAEEPYTSRGCFAQAWSVAEALRVSVEYRLFVKERSSIEIVL